MDCFNKIGSNKIKNILIDSDSFNYLYSLHNVNEIDYLSFI